MKSIQKALFFLALFFSAVVLISAIGLLYWVDAESSNFAATGLIPIGVAYFWLLRPYIKRWLDR